MINEHPNVHLNMCTLTLKFIFIKICFLFAIEQLLPVPTPVVWHVWAPGSGEGQRDVRPPMARIVGNMMGHLPCHFPIQAADSETAV